MKKIILVAIFASTMLLLQSAKPASPARFSVYTWFTDADMTDPTGTTSTLSEELVRLRYLYPAYIFTGTFQVGLHEFEYGYYPSTFTAIIYSNTP